MTYTGPENPSPAAIAAAGETQNRLHEWAGTVHRLVWERIDALAAAYGSDYPGRETTQEYVARVYAGGQEPFPRGVSIHENLNDNRGYDHVRISGDRVYYGGHFHVWNADETDLLLRWAEVDVPAWVVTDPDGPARYREQTEELAADVAVEQAALRFEVQEITRRILRDQAEGDES